VKEDVMTKSRLDDVAVAAPEPADDADAGATEGVRDADAAPAPEADGDVRAETARPLWRRRAALVAGGVLTALAAALVLFALVAPNQAGQFKAVSFLRLPLEGLLGFAVLLALPTRLRRIVAIVGGAVLGLLVVIKLFDVGFYSVFGRPFDPVLDWTLFDSGIEFVESSIGSTGATVTAIAVVLVAIALPVLMALSVNRLARILARHRTTASRSIALLTVVWVISAALGAQIVQDLPIASTSTTDQARWHANAIQAGLADRETFARESAVDAFRDTPADRMLTALRGKDVLVTFIESYGRSAIEDPSMAPQVTAMLDAGSEKLRAAGFAARTGWLTSPTTGGGSWLAHATLLSGLWINNGQRHTNLLASDRLTLNGAFHKANWRTVGVHPAIERSWPEGDFYGYDHLYDSRNVGYQGPRFSYAPVPDQYTLAAFQRNERSATNRAPVMAEIPLVSSHGPWSPIPELLDWDAIGDGSVYNPMSTGDNSAELVKRSASEVRNDYRRSIEYSVSSVISYLERYGDDNLVMVFLGDHQPAPIVTGANASWDVPITVVARDPAVMDRIAGWNWQDGLRPTKQTPVWRMDAFRDKFLSAFSG
jgi:hypothetical protein